MEKEEAIFAIENFIGDRLLCPWVKHWGTDDFKLHSYYRFAAEELVNRIRQNDVNPKTVIENYLIEMDTEYENSGARDRQFLFSCLRDCASDILFLL